MSRLLSAPLLAAALMSVSSALAAQRHSTVVHDLRSGLLRAHDLPTGYGRLRDKMYTRFTEDVQGGIAFCYLRRNQMRAPWVQAIAQDAFQPGLLRKPPTKPRGLISWCGYRFSDAMTARTTYLISRVAMLKQIPSKGGKLSLPRTADASTAVWGIVTPPATSAPTEHLSALVLHRNVLLDFNVYDAPARMSSSPTFSAFRRIIQTVNNRLH